MMKKKQQLNEFGPVTMLIAVVLGIIGKELLKRFIKSAKAKVGMKVKLTSPELRAAAKSCVASAISETIREISSRKPAGQTQVAIEALQSDVNMKIDSGELETMTEVLKYIEQAVNRAMA
jgi:hypothetical protein